MKYPRHKWALVLLMLVASCCTRLALPPPAEAQLHDPMRPSRAARLSTDVTEDKAVAALPPLRAIMISPSSKVAIFGDQRLHEGEHLGRYRIKRIHPGRVELFDGDSHIERRLFPAITAFEDNR